MIKSNERIFIRLLKHATLSGRVIESSNSKRWITTVDEDKTFLKSLKVLSHLKLSDKCSTAVYEYNDIFFFAAIGFDDVLANDAILMQIEINAGIITALLSDLEIPLKHCDPLQIVDSIFQTHSDIHDYIGHDAFTVASFFEPIQVYSISQNSPILHTEDQRLCCHWITQNRERIVLPLSDETLSIMETIVVNGVASIPFEKLLVAFQCSHWSHAFLEVYRCIERLFSFQIIEDLHLELNLKISLLQFAQKVESCMGWRPREEDAFGVLLRSATADTCLLFQGLRSHMDTQQELSKWIYEIRNSIVHFRPGTKSLGFSATQWDIFLRASLRLVNQFYSKYHPQLGSS